MKSQGSIACPSTRSSHERGSQIRKNGRRLRHHHQHHHEHSHAPKTPSNLDIFEQHTQEVLKRLEMSPFEDVCQQISTYTPMQRKQKSLPYLMISSLVSPVQDPSFSLKVKFNKVSTASAAAAESKLVNHLHLVMCNGRIIR